MPTTPSSRRNSQRSRRGSTPPTPGQNGSKLAGRIMWLPHADELSSSTGFSEESHNHPVLVLSKKIPADGKVDILFMTSFGGTDLETRHRYSNAQLRGIYLPIDPSPPHPDNNIQLQLDHGVPAFKKNSYVNTRDRKKILFSLLRNYDRHRKNKIYTITDASYQIVVEHSGYREPIPPVYDDRFTVPVPLDILAQAHLEVERKRSQGYGTIPSVTPQLQHPASRPIQSTARSDHHSYSASRPVQSTARTDHPSYNSYDSYNPYYSDVHSQRKRNSARPSGHSSGGSPDDLSPSAQVVFCLIIATTFACVVAAVYMTFSYLFKDLKAVDWHKVANAVGSFFWDCLVAMGKILKYLVVGMAKSVAWVAKSAWVLVRDWLMGTPEDKLKPF
ncbi:hypothetical protein GE21DRAFT_1218780 [Neurospora crassa]|nr:hypothetical protein GE21DRAFT_1218780 [Neurospora crassa]